MTDSMEENRWKKKCREWHVCGAVLHYISYAKFSQILEALWDFGSRNSEHDLNITRMCRTSTCFITGKSIDYNYRNALRQAIVFSTFCFVKNRSCMTQINITKIAAKCILVVDVIAQMPRNYTFPKWQGVLSYSSFFFFSPRSLLVGYFVIQMLNQPGRKL